MAVYMIATVTRDFKQKIGVRLYDSKTKEYKDCPIENVAQFLISGHDVKNMCIDSSGKVVCTNGEFENYANVVLGIGIAGKSPLVITKVLANGSYEVVNGHGECSNMSLFYLMKYADHNGIANGKIINNNGEYSIIPWTEGAEFEYEKVKDIQKMKQKLKMKAGLLGDTSSYLIDENGRFKWMDGKATDLFVPSGVTTLYDSTFEVCSNAYIKRTLKLPGTLKDIGDNAFKGLYGVNEVKLPAGVLKIGDRAFANSGIKTADIPPTVKMIANRAFFGLNKVVFHNRNQKELIEKAIGPATKVVYTPWKG